MSCDIVNQSVYQPMNVLESSSSLSSDIRRLKEYMMLMNKHERIELNNYIHVMELITTIESKFAMAVKPQRISSNDITKYKINPEGRIQYETEKDVEITKTKIRGVTFYDVPWDKIKEGDLLYMLREDDNELDSNSIAIYWKNILIGHISKPRSKILAPLIDNKIAQFCAEVLRVTGGGDKPNHGCNIRIIGTIKDKNVKFNPEGIEKFQDKHGGNIKWWGLINIQTK